MPDSLARPPHVTPSPDIRSKARDFHDQFLLCRVAPEPPDGWLVQRHGDWHLLSHPSLPVIRLLTPDGTTAGFALGHPIGPDGRLARGSLQLPADTVAAAPSPATLENWIYTFGGRFVFVVLLDGMQRIYLDPGGTLAAVWCPVRQRVASTTSLLLLDQPDHPMFRIGPSDFPLNKPLKFFPAHLTAAEGVSRLLGNHFLDLHAWRTVRHHPLAAYEYVAESEIPGIIAQFHEIVRRQIGAAVQECGGAYVSLSAGEDSRRLLACSRDFIDRIECVTLKSLRPSRRASMDIDAHIPPRLARRVGFRHRMLPLSYSDQTQFLDYALRIGYSGGFGKVCRFWDPPLRHLDLSKAFFTGHVAHVAKIKYPEEIATLTRPTPESILKNLKLPRRPEFLDALEQWLASLPDGPPAFHHDMAMLELTISGWMGAHFYGFAPFRIVLPPFCHRRTIDSMLRLPPRFRAGGCVARAVINLAWPELLCLPFNEYTGLKRWEHRACRWFRRIRKPKRAHRRAARAKKRVAR